MRETNTATTSGRKARYLLGIATAILGLVLSLFEPTIYGLKLTAISLCATLAVLVSLLKLRSLRSGTGWVFPATDSVLLWAIIVEVWLHLWFSH